MPTSVYSVRVACPLETAFDYVADVRRHPEWATDRMTADLLTPGNVGVGARYRTVGHSEVWNSDNVADVEVTVCDRPAAFEIVCRDPHGEFRHRFTLGGSDGDVLIERHYTTPDQVPEEARKRVAAMMATYIEPARQRAMEKLKERLEAQRVGR